MKPRTILNHSIAALLLGAALHTAATAADFTSTWNGTTGNWSDATKWSTNPTVPNNGGSTFDVIQSAGVLTLDQAATIQKYNLTGSTNTGTGLTLTLNELFTFSGATLNGTGDVNANGGATISGGTKTISGGRVLNLGGNSTWSAGTIQLGATSQLNNAATMILDNTFDGSIGAFSGGGGTFNNAGIFTKSAGTGTTAIGSTTLGSFNNTGTVNANSGTLSLQTLGGTHTNGAFNVISGATLNFGSGTHTINGTASVTGTGTGIVSFSGVNGTVNFNAGTYSVAGTTQISGSFIVANFNAAAATNLLTLSSGTLGGTATITASGLTTFSGGIMTGAGTTQADGGVDFSGGTKTISGGRVLNLGGNSTWSAGSIGIGGSSQLNNAATMILDNTFDGTITPVSGSGGTFNNAGIFTKSAGAGTTAFNSSLLTFNNTGTVNVNSGTLSLGSGVTQQSGTTLTGGTWNVTNGSTLNITLGSDIQTNQGNVTLDGAGSTFAHFTTALNNNQGSFTLKNNRDLTTAGAYANSGTTRVQDSTTVMTIGAAGASAYTQSGPTSVTLLAGGATIDASAFNLNGGLLQGTGTIDAPLTTSGATIIAPGASPGTITINGSAVLGSGNTLTIEVGGLAAGTTYDVVAVNGGLTLGGLLDVDFINGFQSSVQFGDVFTIATATSPILGNFFNVASGGTLSTPQGPVFTVFYGAGSGFGANNLVLTQAPEPTSALLLLGSGMMLLGRRRRAAAR